MLTRPICSVLFIAVAAMCLSAQRLPKTIRGYKLYDPPSLIQLTAGTQNDIGPKIAILNVEFKGVGLTGLDLAAKASIADVGVSGEVDFIVFRDMRVNGLPVQITEYSSRFKIKEQGSIALGSSFVIFIPVLTAAKATHTELIANKAKWSVSGTALVFGRFRRLGFAFKRVVPVRINIDIDNPLPLA